jgi:hypothetical protein
MNKKITIEEVKSDIDLRMIGFERNRVKNKIVNEPKNSIPSTELTRTNTEHEIKPMAKKENKGFLKSISEFFSGDPKSKEVAKNLAAQRKALKEKKAQEAKKIVEDKKAEAKRKVDEVKKIAEEKKAEAKRKADEVKKIAEEKKAEALNKKNKK